MLGALALLLKYIKGVEVVLVPKKGLPVTSIAGVDAVPAKLLFCGAVQVFVLPKLRLTVPVDTIGLGESVSVLSAFEMLVTVPPCVSEVPHEKPVPLV